MVRKSLFVWMSMHMTDGFRPYLLLSFLCLLLYLPGLASVPPFDRDESRFAQASKQMMESGDFVDIRFMDEARHKKPAGIYWLQAAAVTLLSDVEVQAIWAYRVPSVLAAWAAVLLTFAGAQALVERRTALLASVLLATSAVVILEAHQAKTDATLLFCVVAAQAVLMHAYAQARGAAVTLSVPLIAGFWIALGIGILIKGPIAPMVVFLTAFALSLWDRNGRWLRALRPSWGVPLMLTIALPWVIAIWIVTDGAFFAEAIGHDMLGKVTSGQDSHGAPPGYHTLLLNLMFWPAALVIVPAVFAAWRHHPDACVRFCIAWVLPAWLVFEITATKLPHYTSPMYPGLALLCAYVLCERGIAINRWVRGYVIFWTVLSVAVAVGLGIAPLFLNAPLQAWSLVPLALGLAAAAVGATAVWHGVEVRRLGLACMLGGLMLSSTIGLVMPNLSPMWLSERVQNAILQEFGEIPPVAATGYREPSLVFLTRTDITFTSGSGAAAFLLATPGAVAVVDEREIAAFRDAIAKAAATVREIAVIEGLNYSKGDDKTLLVVALE